MNTIKDKDTPRIDAYVHMICLLMTSHCTIAFLAESARLNQSTVSTWLHRLHDKGAVRIDGILHPGTKGGGHGAKRWRWQSSLFAEDDNVTFIYPK